MLYRALVNYALQLINFEANGIAGYVLKCLCGPFSFISLMILSIKVVAMLVYIEHNGYRACIGIFKSILYGANAMHVTTQMRSKVNAI